MAGPIITNKLSNIIAAVVTSVWALSFVADIIMPNYDPSPFVHLVMMAVVGSAVGTGLLNKSEEK